jgi:ACR3 family arsenite efflux pump ArsB
MADPTAFDASATHPTLARVPKRLGVFERYLSLWVGLCMVAGVLIYAGTALALRSPELAGIYGLVKRSLRAR